MSKDKNTKRSSNPHAARESIDYEPPGWLSTEELEQELFLAVVADSNRPASTSQVSADRRFRCRQTGDRG
jgi:hypothetical protein